MTAAIAEAPVERAEPMRFSFLILASCLPGESRYGIYLEPSNRIVYTRVGDDEKPIGIAMGLCLDLGWIPAYTSPESLRVWLKTNEAQLDKIAGGFSLKDGSQRGTWTRESLRAADGLRSSLQKAIRDRKIGLHWKASEWWSGSRDLVEDALAARSLEAFVGVEIQRARAARAWIDFDEALGFLRGAIEDRRRRLEDTLVGFGHSTWPDVAAEHDRLDRVLGRQSEQAQPDWDLGSDDAVALQREIVAAIRAIDQDATTRARMAIRSMNADRTLDRATLLAALSAAVSDAKIWDALSQIRQVTLLEEA